ncbi:MAG: TlpA family protein disulfide reductase [Candidatus Ornithomonoglobus sp.]
MKKILYLILAGCMSVSLICACGNKNESSTNADESSLESMDEIKLSAADGIDMTKFSIADTNGNTVNEEVFADYDITLVNFWTTWCPYCLEEIPYLNEMYDELPDNVNIIGVCTDAFEESEEFESLLQQLEPNFTIIGATEEFNSTVGTDNIQGYPTTVFVDKDANAVGMMVGVPCDGSEVDDSVKNNYMKLINEALEKVNE